MNNCKNCGKLIKAGRICPTCLSRNRRNNNPVRYAFDTLRTNAKRRGKIFELSFEQFKQFAIKSKYCKKKGIYADNYHIDRIDETKGYIIDNIQLLTNSANVRKYLDYKWSDDEHKMKAKLLIYKHIENNSDCPF